MRTDIDEAREDIIRQLRVGVSQRAICSEYQCKPETLRKRLSSWGVDHLSSQPGRGRIRPGAWRPATEYLKANSQTNIHRLKLKLWRDGLRPMQCEECGWARRATDGRLPLELDHINGDRRDNRLENLRILCPNCHSLRDNHRGLSKGKSRRLQDEVKT